MNHNTLKKYLKSQKKWLIEFLLKILSVPSESGKEEEAIRILYEYLKDLGTDCRLIPIENSIKDDPGYSDVIKGLDYTNRHNLRIEEKGSGDRTVALNTHIDVVPPSPGQKDPYKPYTDKNGNIFSRGACDAKGQIAVMALILKASKELQKLKNNLICHFVIEEEIGGNGTLAMIRHESDKIKIIDSAINLEPTDLRIMSSIRGAVWFSIRFSGKSGHSGGDASEVNPIYRSMEAIRILRKYHSRLYELSKDFGLFSGIKNPMPLTIGEFNAGEWPSMIPNSSTLRGVLGFLPNKTSEDIIAEYKSELDRPENAWIKKDMKIKYDYRHNATELPVSHWLVKKMSKACRECSIDIEPNAMTASTDAVFYHEKKIPVIAFGPGSIKNAHSADEYINIDEILKAAEVLISFLEAI